MVDQPPRKPKDVPFYKTPENVKTSAQIIEDAKNSLNRPQVRPLSTRRPETPLEGQRKLFGEQSIRDPKNRPPSAISLGSRHYESESRPVSGTRLLPLDHKPRTPNLEKLEAEHKAPKPPADPNRPIKRPISRQRLYQQSSSVDGGEPGQPITARSKSGSWHDVSVITSPGSSVPNTPENSRKVHSGPKERTPSGGDSEAPDVIHRSESRSKRRAGKDSVPREGERAESGYASDMRESSAGSQRTSSAGKPGSGSRRDSSAGRRESSAGKKEGSAVRRDSSAGKREGSAGRREGSAGKREGSAGKREGSAGKREEESAEEAHFYNTRIGPTVDKMATHIKEKNPEKLAELADQLYTELEEANLLGKNCKRRPLILKTVFKLLDLDSPVVVLKLARLILSLKVSGNNLTNVCKLVFKVARDEQNDLYFMKGDMLDLLIDTIRSTDHTVSAEALVYCAGSLKILSVNSTLVKHLVKRHAVEACSRLLTGINKTSVEGGKINEQLGHVLVQITACLRNLADVGGTRNLFLHNNVIQELCRLMEIHSHDADLMLNVSRIFSKITIDDDCCQVLASTKSYISSFVQILQEFQKNEDLTVRISFILGNLTALNEEARQNLYAIPKALDILVGVFNLYIELDHKSQAVNNKTSSKGPNKKEDVLVKVIRVIANLSISEDIGSDIATHTLCVELLGRVLDNKSIENSEELVLNTMATINNLSYYDVQNSAVMKRQLELAESLVEFMDVRCKEGLTEATRVFGNLSRGRPVRDFIVKKKVDEALVVMLDSKDQDMVYTACGVLINLMADEEKRPVLKKLSGIGKLIDVLRDFGRLDWKLAGMVCQTLWNYSGKITSTTSCFGEEESQDLADLLEEFLDAESALGDPNSTEEVKEVLHERWQENFVTVASQLLQRIESHQSDFEALDGPS